ncbi:MAG: hypothetical protein ACK4FZ_01345 [Vogesella sp.]|uniref:hypothetical protein n=1 Tax=Vogesella sp. TaxID=1904252 RepID=UPI0039196E58
MARIITIFVLAFCISQRGEAIEYYAHSLEGGVVDNNGVLMPIPNSGSRAFALAIVQHIIDDKKQDQIRHVPLSRALKLLNSDKAVVVAGIISTPKRSKKFNWIGALYVDRYKFYEIDSHTVLSKRVSDHLEASICVVADSAAEEIVEGIGFNNIHRVGSYSTCLRMLEAKRIRFVPILESDFRAKIYGARLGLTNIRESGLPSVAVESHLVASFQVKPEDVAMLRKRLVDFKKSKHYADLMRTYLYK